MSIFKSKAGYLTSLLAFTVVVLGLSTIQYAQGPQGPPQSEDPTINQPSEVATTATEQAAICEKMMQQIENGAIKNNYPIKNPRSELVAKAAVKSKSENDQNGNKQADLWHVRFDQVYQGIPVKGGHLKIDVDPDNAANVFTVHGDYLQDPEVNTKPKFNGAAAIQIVRKYLQDHQKQGGGKQADVGKGGPDPQLLVDDGHGKDSASLEIHPGGGPGKRKLSYHVSVEDNSFADPVQMHAWVDQDGQIVEAYNNIQSDNGLGETLYQSYQGYYGGYYYGNGYFKIAWYPAYATYVLNDNGLRIGTYDMYGTTGSTYQASSGYSTIFGNGFTSNRNSSNADAHWATVQTFSFMYYILGRNFVDGAGGPRVYGSVDGLGTLISARNHYGYRYNNAFWDGQKINLGDGDGATFGPLTTLDIIGHEWHHGLTQYTAGLNYIGESGALNEAFSDIFGAMTERYWKGQSANTWLIGEGSWTPGTSGDALRYMNAPWVGGQPWYYKGTNWYFGSGDNYGVHTNSGVANYAFYLLSTNYASYGMDANKATQIFYRALRYYMIPTDGYYWARICTLWAARDLYGLYSPQWYATYYAWNAVGVYPGAY